jgi:ribosomal protein S18 acetylase RimI-like enzyme
LPDFRRQSIAEEFINIGEKWMKEHGVNEAATDTSLENKKLINLLQKFGYRETFRNDEILCMSKKL